MGGGWLEAGLGTAVLCAHLNACPTLFKWIDAALPAILYDPEEQGDPLHVEDPGKWKYIPHYF